MLGNNTRKLSVYLSLSQTIKMSYFSFYLLCFFFYKIGKQKGGNRFCSEGGGLAPAEGGGSRERGRKMNMAQCRHMYVNAKMIPIETVPEIRGEGRQEREGWHIHI
jgi:hypothetical protein